MSDAVHPVLRRLFATLLARDLAWVLLRFPEDLAAPSGDVDLLVDPGHTDAFVQAAREAGFVAMPGWEAPPNLLLVCYDRPTDRWLLLDVVTTVGLPAAGWQSREIARRVLSRRRVRDGVAVPADEDAFWLLLFHCLFEKRGIAPHYRRRLIQLAPAEAGSPVAAAVRGLASPEWLAHAVRCERWAALDEQGRALAAELRRRRRRRGGAASDRGAHAGGDALGHLGGRARAAARRALLLRRRRGVSVALIGPNGVGKSTLAAGVQRAFPFESRIVYMGLWRAGGPRIGGAAGAAAARPVRIWLRYLEGSYHRARGRLVVFDRYVYEAALPPSPPYVALKRPYHWLLRHAVPSAEAVVLLDVPGEVAYARKQENPPGELEWERLVYRRLASSVPTLEVVDASRPADAVRADVMALVWRSSRRRWQGRARARSDASCGGLLANACALVPRIVAATATTPPPPGARGPRIPPTDASPLAGALITTAELTGTRAAVVTLAPPGKPPRAVVTVGAPDADARELARETDALAVLGADDRLGEWRRLIPRPLAFGEILELEQPYRVDAHLRGRRLDGRLPDPRRRAVVLESAVEAIHVLHASTAAPGPPPPGAAERWIDASLTDLERSGATRNPRFRARAARLRAELHEAVRIRAPWTSWIHGDYWPGNLLVGRDGTTITGILDWDAADPAGLPLHDVVHLVLFTRSLTTGREVGDVVREQLERPGLDPLDRRILDRYAGWPLDDASGYREALLLSWLRHVALHARQHARRAGPRYRVWEHRNVHVVLEAL